MRLNGLIAINSFENLDIFYFFSTIKPITIKSNSHLAFSSTGGFDNPCRISHQLH
jgi:hypothetical protein